MTQAAPTATHYPINGRLFVRVTEFLRAVGASDFSKIPTKDREFYMDRGTANHDAWAKVEEGVADQYDFDPRVKAYLPAHAKFLKETGFKAIPGGIERRVHATWRQLGFPVDDVGGAVGIAGTMDRIGTVQGMGLWLVDYKSSSLPPAAKKGGTTPTALQTALYLMMTTYEFSRVSRYGVAFRNNGKYSTSTKYPYDDKAEVLGLIAKFIKEKSNDAH